MMASSNWNTVQMGIELSRPYYQSAIMSGQTPWQSTYSPQPFYGGYTGYSGWTPWSSPYGSQTYNRYGGYPWGY